jgi:FimV-like protein
MIAIYHENPKAFEGNINRLRLGAVLTIPSSPEVSKISVADANHEVRVQMETWRAALKLVTPTKPVEPAVAASAPVPHESAIPTESAAGRQESISNAPQAALHAPGNTAETSDDSALDRRIQILEQGLNELQGALAREQATLAAIQTRVALADDTRAVTAVPATAKSGRGFGASSAAILVLASGAWGALYLWRGRRRLNPLISAADAVDVLNGAVKREPNRRDLRMKLLETYYAAAATSRQGFLQLAQSLAGEREHMSDGEWNKIAGMGRQIAADNDLFTPGTAQPDNKHLATYA